MKQRIISAAVMIPIVILAICLSVFFLHALVAIVAGIGVYEMNKSCKQLELDIILPINYTYVFLGALAIGFGRGNVLFAVLLLFIIIACSIGILSKKYSLYDIMATIFVLVYPTTLLFLLSGLAHNGRAYVIAAIISANITDMVAFFVGRKFGSNKLAPEISPNKTIEGALGGLAGSLVLMTTFGLIFISKFTFVNFLVWILISLLLGVAAQVGDLFASLIKRRCGIKDFSNLIPGHGGVIDRTDSVMYTTLIVYLFVALGII